jgi:predicted ribosome-associated RNA-binding protein Tma20
MHNISIKVYFVWDHPDAFPILHIHSSIFGFIEKGSDLMIPGLLLDFAMPDFQANCPLAITMINEDENGEFLCFGPIAVGRALLSSAEMQERREAGQKGKGLFLGANSCKSFCFIFVAVEILHIFGDSLW